MNKIIAISGESGSGKTTLLKQIIAHLCEQGFNVGVIKHAHHDIELDLPGKDSYELRKAGAIQTAVACNNRYAMIYETPNQPIDIDRLLQQFVDVDLVLLEGFKNERIPKIICHRSITQKTLFVDALTLAIATDYPLDVALPQLDINDPLQIVTFIKQQLCLTQSFTH